MIFTLRPLRAMLALGLLCFVTAAWADDAPDAAKPEAGKSAAADRSLREQDIYIPYEKLRQVFEKQGRGVFMPYEKFDELWRAAQDKTRPAAVPQPPVGAVITDIDNEATVAKDVVQVKAHVKIDLLTEGWHEVPLRLSDAALVHATLNKEPARILGGAGQDHRLLVEKKGKQPEQIELDLEYARAITRTPGQNSVSFQAPQAAVSRWKVRIPQAGVKVNILPMIAATEVPADSKDKDKPSTEKSEPAKDDKSTKPEKSDKPEKPSEETVILAFVGASPTVQIEWTPKAEGATGLAALASVQSEQQVWIQEGIARIRTNLVYSISRSELNQLVIEAPADYKVVNVFDANVRGWSVAPPAGQVQQITVQLFEPAKTSQHVTVELERINEKKQDTLNVPVVKALNVVRQQGFVVVNVGAGLRAEASRTANLLQVDAAELPQTLRPGNWAFAYRYATVPFELLLSLEELQPRLTVDSLVEARLEPERLTLDLTAVYTIERAGVFKLELDVPEGFEVRHVQGRAINSGPMEQRATAAEVDSHHLEGDKKTHMIVNLARKALGRVALSVQLQKELRETNLLTPTGKSTEIALPVPQVTKATVERASGRLVIHAPESLRVNPVKADGLRTVSFKEALDGMSWALAPPVRQQAAAPAVEGRARAELRPVLNYTFTQDPIDLRLAVERLKPQVSVEQQLVARIEEGVVKYQDALNYSVLYSGVRSFRIDVPADVTIHVQNSPGIREKMLDPQPAELAKEKLVAWTLTSDNEILGERQITLVWEKRFDKVEVGKSVNIDVPQVLPRDVHLSSGQIVLTKAETLDVREQDAVENLQPIDPQHEVKPPVAGGVRAFAFVAPWKLPITVTRYELEEVKRTSIDRAVVRMVITQAGEAKQAGEVAVQALYRIRSARPRLAVRMPADAVLDSDPLRINGQLKALQQGTDQLFVPLDSSSADEPFLLELRYTVPGGRALELPVIGEGLKDQENPAVQKVYLCVFVPKTQVLLGSRGPWSEEFTWCFIPDGRWMAANSQDDTKLANWVCDQTKATAGSASTFHTDGTLYVFSTIRPAPDSTLRLTIMSGNALSGLIFGLIAVVGFGLLWVRAAGRVLAIGAIVVALVLVGVFLPTLSLHVLDGKFALAIALVLVLWFVVFVFRIRRPAMACCSDLGERMKRKPAPAAASQPPTAAPAAPSEPAPPAEPPATPSEGGPSHE